MDRLALITDSAHQRLIKDDRLLVERSQAFGFVAEAVVWNDNIRWQDYACALVRTPWDYIHHKEDFLRTMRLASQQTQLFNCPELMQWNADKNYLLELATKSSDLPNTCLLNPKLSFREQIKSLGREIVVKPVVSSSAWKTLRLTADECQDTPPIDIDWHERQFIAQEFVDGIVTEGEISFIFFGQEFSHALIKRPKTGDFRVQESHGGTSQSYLPSQLEVQQAQTMFKYLPSLPLYARLDLARLRGKLVIMEWELIEPELFFRTSKNAEDKLLQVLRQRCQS